MPTSTDSLQRLPRIAVVGTGYWGKNLVRNLDDLGALAAVCDSDEERLTAIRKQYGPHLEAFSDYEHMLETASIDAVVVATPAVTHDRLARQAILADKDVFVEKPVALSLAAGRELVELAEQRQRILMVGHLLWYHPAVIELKRLVDAGELGRLRYIYSNRLNFGRFRVEENILWSFAPHDISVILGLTSEMPSQVEAYGAAFLNPEVADVTVSTMAFPSGAMAHLFVSWLHPFKEQRLVVIGDRMMATFQDRPDGAELLLYPHGVSWENSIPIPDRADSQPVRIADGEPLKAECEHFIECIQTRQAPRTDGAEGLRVLEVLERCQQALRNQASNGWIAPPEQTPPMAT